MLLVKLVYILKSVNKIYVHVSGNSCLTHIRRRVFLITVQTNKNEPPHEENQQYAYAKPKGQLSFAVTAKLVMFERFIFQRFISSYPRKCIRVII